MAWDSTAKRVAIKAIGQVESSMNYAAINYNDPITVGIGQWYGVRAAAILNRLRNTYAAQYARVESGFRARLESIPESDSSWNTYYLSRQVGDSLRDLLLAGKDIQDSQIIQDLDSYVNVAMQYGINPESDTDAFILWCVAYHQGPRWALQVANNYNGAGLNAMYSAIMSNAVFGRYSNRYSSAKNIIATKDTSDVGVGINTHSSPGNNGNPGANVQTTNVSGGKIVITANSNGTLILRSQFGNYQVLPKGLNFWEANLGDIQQKLGSATAGNIGATPSPGGGSDKGIKALAWVMARLGKFAYLQGAGRLDPDHSGVTDCSGLCYAAYKYTTGTFVGTWTGDQYFRGSEVMPRGGGAMTAAQRALLRPGDMIVMAWKSTGSVYPETDHVEMVVDSNTLVGHGGNPYYGPVTKSINILSATRWWTVRRHS